MDVGTRPVDLQAFWLTLRLAGVTTALLLMGSLPLAWWIAAGRGWRRSIVQAGVALPLMLPPTVLGFYLLIGMGPLTPSGRWLTRLLGHPLAFRFEGLVVGSLLYSLPFAVQPMVVGFQAIGREQVEAAAVLGASPMRAFATVTLPLAWRSVLTSAVLAFTHTMGEFGVVLMLGGNIPGSTRTMSISLYDLVEDGRYAEANRTSLLLLLISFGALLVVYLRRPRREFA